jgi:hypothetical protein
MKLMFNRQMTNEQGSQHYGNKQFTNGVLSTNVQSSTQNPPYKAAASERVDSAKPKFFSEGQTKFSANQRGLNQRPMSKMNSIQSSHQATSSSASPNRNPRSYWTNYWDEFKADYQESVELEGEENQVELTMDLDTQQEQHEQTDYIEEEGEPNRTFVSTVSGSQSANLELQGANMNPLSANMSLQDANLELSEGAFPTENPYLTLLNFYDCLTYEDLRPSTYYQRQRTTGATNAAQKNPPTIGPTGASTQNVNENGPHRSPTKSNSRPLTTTDVLGGSSNFVRENSTGLRTNSTIHPSDNGKREESVEMEWNKCTTEASSQSPPIQDLPIIERTLLMVPARIDGDIIDFSPQN